MIHKTLKKSLKEFDNKFEGGFCGNCHNDRCKNLASNAIKSHLTNTSLSLIDSVMEMVEGKKKPKDWHTPNCLRGECKNNHFFCGYKEETRPYNYALTDILSLLQQEKDKLKKL